MISSGLCFLLGIHCPFRGPDYHSLWATQQGADHDYGPSTTIYNRFNRWVRWGLWQRVFKALVRSTRATSN
ncbi:hypothetical protein HY78_18470 [Rhizorhabdus wittichii DC-6]|nr:hypothetical protein HY78_18470 [Rhizorhabdus wittichii DC-6]